MEAGKQALMQSQQPHTYQLVTYRRVVANNVHSSSLSDSLDSCVHRDKARLYGDTRKVTLVI